MRSLFSTLSLSVVCCASALGQATVPSAFIANNGNLEGSVSSYTFNPDGSPNFVMKLITGTRSSFSEPVLGCNAYAISITPNGRYLATCHAAGDYALEQITILRVLPDASLVLVGEYLTPQTPLDIQWITDNLLAVTRTNTSGPNEVLVYEFNEEEASLTERDRKPSGSFTGYLAVHPARDAIYSGDSSTFTIRTFGIAPNGAMTQLQAMSTSPVYPLGINVNRQGDMLCGTGGISNNGNKVSGYAINADRTLTLLPGSPFISPGSSPKDITFSRDGTMAYVAHGTDATVRSFFVDRELGTLTATGHSFDVGLQGSLGDAVVFNDLLLVTDNTTAIDGLMGLYSFTRNPDGSMTQNGAIVPSTGVAPTEIAVWTPTYCDLETLAHVLSSYGHCDGEVQFNPYTDLNGDGCTELGDLAIFMNLYGADCN